MVKKCPLGLNGIIFYILKISDVGNNFDDHGRPLFT